MFGLIYVLLERGILGGSTVYPATGNPYDFQSSFFVVIIFGTITGWIQGAIEVFFLQKVLNHRSFAGKVILKMLIYLVGTIAFVSILPFVANILMPQSTVHIEVWSQLQSFISNFAFWSIVIYIGIVIFFTVFISGIADHLGQGVLVNFVFGKYFSPNQEERIFMFLDMNDSTPIAERLGHVKYFEFLRDYFDDMSDSIIECSGEVYQYVGDEIVISWELQSGLKNENCLRCYYMIDQALKAEKEKYLERYGVLPTYKAGIHCGVVTSGEIGKLKQDILYTGDVLNTTARIQGKCIELDSNFLTSKDLYDQIKNKKLFHFMGKGTHLLRGRKAEIQLYGIEANGVVQ